MEHFITLFDSNFLPQGLALHDSLRRYASASTLWVLCMDARTQDVLDRLKLDNLRTIALADVEFDFPELLAVKAGRNRAEYCWTLTPFTPRLVFDREPSASRVTYVDADVFFLSDPNVLFEEFDASGKAVQITDHAYDPEYDHSALSGRYCVQFMTFVRDRGEPVRLWWQERCLEWCFERAEAGRFGDQKYLDDWPERFADSVHVLSRNDALLAPWNARRFPYSSAVAWHFHGLRLLAGGGVLLHSRYRVPRLVDDHIYLPYVAILRSKMALIGFTVVQARVPFIWLRWLKSAALFLSQRWYDWSGLFRVIP